MRLSLLSSGERQNPLIVKLSVACMNDESYLIWSGKNDYRIKRSLQCVGLSLFQAKRKWTNRRPESGERRAEMPHDTLRTANTKTKT
jgi:hypothetical protein